MAQTRSGAEEMASRMRRETAEDIRKMLSEIEMARASAEDELETQRILTETARVRAFSHGLAAESAPDEMARTNDKLTTIGTLGSWEPGIQEAEMKESASRKPARRRKSTRRARARRAAPNKEILIMSPVAEKTSKPAAKKAVAKKPAVKKAVAKKTVAKKAVAKKPAAKKAVAKKPAVKKAVAKKSIAKKAIIRKPAAKKAIAKPAAKKAVAKRAISRKPAARKAA